VYLRARPKKRRTALIIAIIAFVSTLVVVFGYAILQEPSRLVAAFPLPDLITRTPTLIGDFPETPTRLPTATRPPTSTRTPTATLTPMATVAPTRTPHPLVEHFILGRPLAEDANQLPERFYAYGTSGRGDYEVHRGTDITNLIGTPLVAIAPGTVVVAGNDKLPQCGAGGNEVCGQYPDFYGNVVIIKLDHQYDGEPVYVLYGHLSRVDVRPGQHVAELEPIGAVGQEGIAVGPHVHIEVRLGANSYATTRNPMLWMRPLPGTGALAGRLLDKNGNPLRAQSILIYADDIDGTYIGDTETYSRDNAPPVNSDDVLKENWAFPDLPAGTYVVRAYVGSLQYSRRVTVEPGKLTFVIFGG
jgi:murein DD-endopeptidase MepM/ murein hydrolase activator NlpD